MSLFEKKYVVELFGQKSSYVESGKENLRISNEMSARFQTLVATIILAQLAFLGVLGFEHDESILSAVTITILVFSLIVCLVAISWQQIGVLKGAKHYFKKADEVGELIKETKKKHVNFDEFPADLKAENVLKYTKIPNRLFLAGFVLSFTGSILLLVLVWRLVL